MSDVKNTHLLTVTGDMTTPLPVQNIDYMSFDTMTVQAVSYVGTTINDTIFYVWCTYTNSFVCTFTVDALFASTTNPNVLITLNKMNPNGVSFQIYATKKPEPLTGEDAYLSVVLNFIKYKN